MKVFTISAPRFFGEQTTQFIGIVASVDLETASQEVVENLQDRGYYSVRLSWEKLGVVHYSVIVPGKDEMPDYQYSAELQLFDTGEVSPAEIPVTIWDYDDLSPVIGWPDKLTAQIATIPTPAIRQQWLVRLTREEVEISPLDILLQEEA